MEESIGRTRGAKPSGFATRAVCLATVLLILGVAAPARGEERGLVRVGEVATRVIRARVDLPKALRRALERELAALPATIPAGPKRFVLSASLVRLEPRRVGSSGGIDCTVSAVLREERGGTIRAVLVGKARAEYEGEDAELGALDAAVRGAVASVPAALR